MTASDTPPTIFGMPIELHPYMPPDTIAFRSVTSDGEPKLTFLKMGSRSNAERVFAPDPILADLPRPPVEKPYSYKRYDIPNLCAEIDLSVRTLEEEMQAVAKTRARMHEKRIFETLFGGATYAEGTATTVVTSPDAPTADQIMATMREQVEKMIENDAKLYEAVLALGIEIRVADIVDEETRVTRSILYVPKGKEEALQRAHQKRAKSVRFEKAQTFATMYGFNPERSL